MDKERGMTLVKEAPGQVVHSAGAWKTVLAHVEPGKAGGPRLEAAVSLARRCDALLIGLGAELVEPVTFADQYGSWDAQVLTAMRQQVQDNIAHAKRLFEKHAASVRSDWRQVEDRPTPALARIARAADVIVVGGAPAKGPDGFRRADPAEVALLSGRPVLVAPPQDGALQARSVVVAWKDARESRRAVADALPLLLDADDVLVVEMCGESRSMPDAEFHTFEVAESLRRHGVAAHGKAVCVAEDKIGEALNAEADAIGADLIVAGCYGHSRMNEWFFGGVTRDLLHAPRRFILISH